MNVLDKQKYYFCKHIKNRNKKINDIWKIDS